MMTSGWSPPKLHRRRNLLTIYNYFNCLCERSTVLLTCLIVISSVSWADAVWQDNIQPKIRVTQLSEADVQRFSGNTTHPDHFKLLHQDGDSMLVGARNIIYNISLASLEENKRLEWYSADEDVRMCKLKGKSPDACQNYVRVLARKSDDILLVCGTNAFKPRCREYSHTVSGSALNQ